MDIFVYGWQKTIKQMYTYFLICSLYNLRHFSLQYFTITKVDSEHSLNYTCPDVQIKSDIDTQY